jgi:hypothetical protein
MQKLIMQRLNYWVRYEGRIGFSRLKNYLEFAHAANANSSEALNGPYKETTIDGVQKPLLSSV